MRLYLNAIAIIALSASPAVAADQTIYYVGTETRTSLTGAPQAVDDLILKKNLLPGESLLVEFACVKKTGSAAEISPVYMRVKDGKISEMSTDKGFSTGPLSGSGVLEGALWDWNYLKFSMSYKTPHGTARIEDENWVSRPYLVAIKELYWQSNDATEVKSEIITAKVREVSADEYRRKSEEMGCTAKPLVMRDTETH